MKFSEQRNNLDFFSGSPTPEFMLSYLTNEHKNLISSLDNKFLEYLTEDIISTSININLQIWLADALYQQSNQHAKECLEFCPSVRSIWGRQIRNWTDIVLKCYDNFLLQYIQIDKRETIRHNLRPKETDVYIHLINKGGTEGDIGQFFKNIYNERSNFHHIQIVNENGIRLPKMLSNKQLNIKRDNIVCWLRQALVKLFELIECNSTK